VRTYLGSPLVLNLLALLTGGEAKVNHTQMILLMVKLIVLFGSRLGRSKYRLLRSL